MVRKVILNLVLIVMAAASSGARISRTDRAFELHRRPRIFSAVRGR